jgi:hypothetical protein
VICVFAIILALDAVALAALWLIGRALSPDARRIRENRRRRADIREALKRSDVVN